MLGGAAIGGLGSYLSGKEQADAAKAAAAAAQFRPWAIHTGLGTTDFRAGQRPEITSALSPELAGAQDLLSSRFAGLLGDPASAQRIQEILGRTELGGFGLAERGMGAVGEAFGGLEGLFAGAGAQDRAALAALQQGLGGAGARLGEAPEFAMQQARGLFGDAAQFGAVRDAELETLRAQARPAEERAVNQRLQNLFGTGRLGTTGGAQVLGQLAQAQEQADIGRQLAATQTALGVRGQSLTAGQGLLGLGQQGFLGQAGFLGDAARSIFDASRGVTEADISRGQQRLAAAEGLFGFGTAAGGGALDRATSQLGLATALDDINRANLALSISAGSGQAAAGGNVANALLAGAQSPTGAFFGQLGTGLFDLGAQQLFKT